MNTLDIILLVLLIPGAIRGLIKGFLEQVVSIGGIFLGVYVAYKFSNPVCTWLGQYIHMSETVLHLVGFILVLAGLMVLVVLLAKFLTKVLEMASLGWVNRALGVFFSLVVSALILSLLAVIFDTLNTRFALVNTAYLEDSLLYTPLKDLGYLVFPYLKSLLGLAS